MRVIHHLLCLGLLIAFAAAAVPAFASDKESAGATDRVKIRAILVVASNTKGEPDRKLAPFAANLRANLRFEHFQHAGEATAQLAMPGAGGVSLGRGQRLELEAAYYGGNQIWTRVRWLDGDREFMNTVLILKRGGPAILGGLNRGDETLAVLVIAE